MKQFKLRLKWIQFRGIRCSATQIMQLEIEREAIKRENDDRLAELNEELAV
jgi:hypothetical protein